MLNLGKNKTQECNVQYMTLKINPQTVLFLGYSDDYYGYLPVICLL